MKIFFAMVLFSVVQNSAQAAVDLEKMEFAMIRGARTSEELQAGRKAFARLKILVEACQIEMHDERAPEICYEALQRAHKMGIENPLPLSTTQLDQECLRISQKTRQTENPKAGLLSKPCEVLSLRKVAANRYKLGMPLE